MCTYTYVYNHVHMKYTYAHKSKVIAPLLLPCKVLLIAVFAVQSAGFGDFMSYTMYTHIYVYIYA